MISFYVEYKGGMKMKFLYRLYDQQYFGIILFIIIFTLLLLFLIIFFFGKKDEKEQLEKTKKLELAKNNNKKDNNVESYKEVDGNTKELVIPEIEQPKIEEEVEIDPFEKIEEPQIEINEAKEEIDINSLFELPQNEEKVEVNNNEINIVEPVAMEQPVVNEPVVETPSFNSVYEEPKKEENVPFEMPKLMEMPKLKNDEVKPETTNIFAEEKPVNNNIFDNFENETYDINGRHL